MLCYGHSNRRLVAGNAGDEGASGHAMTIEFGDPSIREHFWSTRRLPAEPRRHGASAVVRGKALDIFREELKKARGEEVTMAVAEWHWGILASETTEWHGGNDEVPNPKVSYLLGRTKRSAARKYGSASADSAAATLNANAKPKCWMR